MGADDSTTSIQSAIDRAEPGDLVVAAPGFYYEHLQLRDGVSLAAEVAGTVFVEAEGDGSAVTALGVGNTTSITGIAFRHGSAPSGGGLYAVASSPVFTDCVFDGNAAVLGGGAYLRDGSRATFTGCTFSNNIASVGGALYLDFAEISVSSSRLFANEASDGGALAAANAAEADIRYTSIYGNLSYLGATIACNLASPRFTNCTVASNRGGEATFALRGSGTRIERSIVAFNAGVAIDCQGFSSPWVGCNILFANASEAICKGDQGTNLQLDPLFCNLAANDFGLAANSPAAGGTCGDLGARPVACPAQGVETARVPVPWTRVKTLYRP